MKSLANDPTTLSALHKVRDSIFTTDAILEESDGETDEIIGQRTRALSKTKRAFDDFFTEIESRKEVKELPSEDNPVV